MDTGQIPAAGASGSAGQAGPRRPARTRRIIGATAAGAVLVGGGIAIGVAVTAGASAATSPGSSAAAHKCARHFRPARGARPESRAGRSARPQSWSDRGARPAARAMAAGARPGSCRGPLLALGQAGLHGQITYKARTGFRTVAFERGTLESVSGSTLTVRAADGTTWTWHLVANSAITERAQQVPASKLARGEQVLVAGPVVSSANDARLVRIRPAS